MVHGEHNDDVLNIRGTVLGMPTHPHHSNAAPYPSYRNLPAPNIDPKEVGSQGWSVHDLPLPTMSLREDALQHNVDLHAAWCQKLNVAQAPHVKTHMSPELTQRQLQAGSWGLSAASAHQARFLASLNVPRILIVQEVVDQPNIAILGELLNADADLNLMVIADSIAGVDALERALAAAEVTNKLGVLVELGLPGGRTGARTIDEATAIARHITEQPHLTLVGVEGYEGVLPAGRDEEAFTPVDEFLADVQRAATHFDSLGLFAETDEIVITAGGSVYPDRVAFIDRPALSKPHIVVVRAGATITHDHGPRSAFAPLAPEAENELGSLRPALEVWANVVSVPEENLALANFGKRDVPFDLGLPLVLEVFRNGEPVSVSDVEVIDTNDQHGFLRHGGQLEVGDTLRLGPRHPCTAFDKWPLIPLINEQNQVTGAVTTWF